MMFCKKNAKVKKSPCVFSQMFEDIYEKIENGSYTPGSLLPSEQGLAMQYRISRCSVRTGLNALLRKNLIEKRPGIGTFVKDRTNTLPDTMINTVGINLSPVGNTQWFSVKIVDTLVKLCEENHCRCSLFGTDFFSAKQINAAMLLMLPDGSDLPIRMTKAGIPVVLFNRVSDHEKIAYVSVDYRKESRNALAFLLKQEKKRILIPDTFNLTAGPRTLGISDALADCPEKGIIYETKGNMDVAYYTEKITEAIRTVNPDGIYLVNGSYAVPTLNAMRALDRNDIPVICFDDIAYLKPMYSADFHSVVMPLDHMTSDAAKYLIAKLRTPEPIPVLKKIYQAKIS